jgi:peptide/nickel transport system substrate-binding protein
MSHRIRRAPAAAAFAAALALTLAACGGGEDDTEETGSGSSGETDGESGSESGSGSTDGAADAGTPVEGGSLTVAHTQAPTSLDLHNEITANNAFVIDKLFEGLVTFDESGEIVPELATDWQISDDGLTYTFTLEDGVQFSDGSELDSEDVVFSLERHLEVGGPLPLHADIASIEATDPTTVTLTLNSPYTPLLGELSGFSNGIIPTDFGGLSEEEFFTSPIGTGAFTVDSWAPGGDIILAANDNYRVEGLPHLDEVTVTVVADDNQLISQVQSGQVDVITQVPPANVSTLESNDDVTVSATEGWTVEELFFNTQDEHFADPHVRAAAQLAIDREGIVEASTFGTATPAGSLLPPSIQYYDASLATSVDIAAAQDEIAQSEFPDGFDTTLLIPSGNTARTQSAQIIQAGLSQIGITVEIETVDLSTFRERFRAFDYSFMVNSAISDIPDPNAVITFQADPEGGSDSYWTHYANDEVTSLIDEGRSTPEGDEREEIYTEIQSLINADAPYVPLYYPQNVRAWGAGVQGITVLPNGSLDYTEAWVS